MIWERIASAGSTREGEDAEEGFRQRRDVSKL